MTEQQHPLTNDICRELWSENDYPSGSNTFMRLGANWQLEQVLNLLDEKIAESPNPALPFIKEKIKQAMRPTQEENT